MSYSYLGGKLSVCLLGAKLSAVLCKIVRCQIVQVPNCPVPNSPITLKNTTLQIYSVEEWYPWSLDFSKKENPLHILLSIFGKI